MVLARARWQSIPISLTWRRMGKVVGLKKKDAIPCLWSGGWSITGNTEEIDHDMLHVSTQINTPRSTNNTYCE